MASTGALDTFRARLKKNLKRLKRELPQKTDCYFAYDRDVPELPVQVEVWGPRARLVEIPGRHARDDAAHMAFLEELRTAAAALLKIDPADMVLRRRLRRRAGHQHGRLEKTNRRHVVHERGLSFWVNVDDYVDTGLFLDHRETRQMVKKQADGRRVLNLFGYTGSFSVYAACGGASEVVTVDLSGTYLSWARANLDLNEIAPEHTPLLEDDAKAWMQKAAQEGERFDLIVLDPPTHSTSERMEGDLDVQRDHVELLARCRAVLSDGGILYFSTNLRSFELDEAAVRARVGAAMTEITDRTQPRDCRHRPHRCFRLEC